MIRARIGLYDAPMKTIRSLLPLAAVAALVPSTMFAASAEMQAEYAQVRKIAMKDPGVRAAYAKADAKLNAKIVDIDPSLKPIAEAGGVAPAPAAKHPAAMKPLQGAPSASSSYVVVKGDTLTSIASRYRVTAEDLKSANGIVDERKLQVGQKLTIPAHSAKAKPAVKRDEGLWSRLKAGL